MADEHTPPPRPRPRRRRTDIDPNAPTPPVARERRRSRRPTSGEDEGLAGPIDAVGTPPTTPDDGRRQEPVETAHIGPSDVSATSSFHVPGLAAAVAEEVADVAVGPPRVDDEVVRRAPIAPAAPAVAAAPAPSIVPSERPSWLTVLDDRSPDPGVCPFLRSTGERGLTAPIETPNPANRCAALTEAVPQSLRQQELVCLTSGHVNCPRYLRGAAVMTETPTPVVRPGRTMSPAMLGSLVVLVMALTASVAFVLARGGALSIGPDASPVGSAPIAVVSPSVPPVSPSAVAEVTPTPEPTPAPTPTPTATPTPTPTSSPTPRPTRTPRPSPTSDRFQLLRACPNTPRCYIYTVRRGDNVFSIARYFGVSQDSIYSRNPWLRNTGLRAGQQLRLPPPTR